MKRFITILLLLAGIPVWSQNQAPRRDTLKVDVSMDVSVGSNGNLKPLWSYSQQWGRYTQYEKDEASFYAKVEYGWTNRKGWFNVKGGVGLNASTDYRRNMLHEAYISGKIWEIDYTFGREARTPISQNDDMGLGTYLMSDNARPIYRAGLGFFDFWAIPGIKNWIEIKGGLYIGKMPDEGSDTYYKNVLFHEKFAYLRIGRFPVKPYLGLVHSVAMGGTKPNGEVIPIDFWASFFGRGSKKLLNAGYPGEYYNACGTHQGLWDLGLEFVFDDFDAKLFYQRPFYDATALYLEDFGKCRDFHLGMDLKLKKTKYVKRLNFEYFTTIWQGGLGLADPYFVSTGPKKTGQVVNFAVCEVTPAIIRDYFAPSMINEWEAEHGPLQQSHVSDFLIKYANKGRPWGNRTPYLMGGYPQGWSNEELSMGYPLYMTNASFKAVASDYGFARRFPDVRMMALNFGISGNILPQLAYRAKVTYTDNYGDLASQYRYDIKNAEFIEVDNYYFSKGRTEVYTGLWLDYRYRDFTFCGSAAWDFGQMYNSFSVRLGVKVALESIPFQKRQ